MTFDHQKDLKQMNSMHLQQLRTTSTAETTLKPHTINHFLSLSPRSITIPKIIHPLRVIFSTLALFLSQRKPSQATSSIANPSSKQIQAMRACMQTHAQCASCKRKPTKLRQLQTHKHAHTLTRLPFKSTRNQMAKFKIRNIKTINYNNKILLVKRLKDYNKNKPKKLTNQN